MKKFYTLSLALVSLVTVFAQDGAPATPYYNNFDFEQTGNALKNALADKITSTHINELTYTPGVWNAIKQTDLDPDNNNYELLVYGFSNS